MTGSNAWIRRAGRTAAALAVWGHSTALMHAGTSGAQDETIIVGLFIALDLVLLGLALLYRRIRRISAPPAEAETPLLRESDGDATTPDSMDDDPYTRLGFA